MQGMYFSVNARNINFCIIQIATQKFKHQINEISVAVNVKFLLNLIHLEICIFQTHINRDTTVLTDLTSPILPSSQSSHAGTI